jgi:hypothetical protein
VGRTDVHKEAQSGCLSLIAENLKDSVDASQNVPMLCNMSSTGLSHFNSATGKFVQEGFQECLQINTNRKRMPSVRMLHRMALVRTGVLEERSASIMRVTRIG